MAAASLPVVCCGSQHGAFNTPVDQRLGLVSYLTHAHARTRGVLNSCLVPAACCAAPTTCFVLSIQQMSSRFTMFSHVKSCLSGTVTSKINYYRRNDKAQRRKPGTPSVVLYRMCVFLGPPCSWPRSLSQALLSLLLVESCNPLYSCFVC